MILQDASYEKTGKSFCDAVTNKKKTKNLCIDAAGRLLQGSS